jgi:DmsE family decaheme c-type cytochrome
MHRRMPLLAALLFAAMLWLVGANSPAADSVAAPTSAKKTISHGAALEKECGECHASAVAAFKLTLHGKRFRDNPRGELELADCASCHGSLDAHEQNPDDPKSIRSLRRERNPDAKLRSTPCLECHKTESLFSAKHYRPLKAGVACSDCHSVMRPVSDRKLLGAPDVNTLCQSCHPGIAAQMNNRSTHIAAGSGINCTDCHNPHGDGRAALKQATVNDTCAPCHRAQAGPFLFEHAPVADNCLNCHTPHGAPQPSLLKMNTGSLCLSCHSQAPFFHAFTGMDRFTLGRSCTNCHSLIHGSNHATGSRLQR